jgi:hypothetical protein
MAQSILAVPADETAALYRPGTDEPALTCSVGWGAGHTVSETDRVRPRFVKWRPYPGR